MKIFCVILFFLLTIFCLFAFGGYVYMTVIEYSGQTYWRPMIQTFILSIFFLFTFIVSVLADL